MSRVYDIRRRTYLFALQVVRLLDQLKSDYISRILGQQLLRAATSVGANVAEAQAAGSRRDFANFYRYALKSANETEYWLNLLHDTERVPAERMAPLVQEVRELGSVLGASLLTLKRQSGD